MKSYERLKVTIEWAAMTTHAFALKIGMNRSENLYRIMKNEENVSIKLSTLILNTFPQISSDWFIYDKGDMLVKDVNTINNCDRIPFYSVLPENIKHLLKDDKPIFNMYIPIFKSADIAITMNDRGMEPIITFGSILILKDDQLSNILLYGNIYYIVIDEIVMVRIIRKSETSDNEIILEAPNNNYDSIVISKDKIKEMYLVCGAINRFL